MDTQKEKIAFIYFGKWSGTNDSLLHAVTRYFPEYTVNAVDIQHELRARYKRVLVINFIITILVYGYKILIRGWNYRFCFQRTKYYSDKVNEIVNKVTGSGKHICSIQTMSYCDASLSGVPNFIITDHTHMVRMEFPEPKNDHFTFYRWQNLERQLFNRATGYFVFSNNIRRSLVEHYGIDPGKVECVYAGSNIKVDVEDIRDDRYFNKNILFIGREWERKGGPQVVEAFEEVLLSQPDARLTIVGSSPDIRLKNCVVVGKIPRQEIHKYYKEASIFCMPSKFEPFGMVYVEAMQYKLPIIASKLGAVPDFLFDDWNGYGVEVDDVEGIYKALLKLLDDPLKCKEFGENSLTLAMERYNWAQVGQRIRQHVLSVLPITQ